MPLPPTPADSPVIYGASLVIPTNPSWADAGDEIRAQLREEQQLHIQTLNERDEARQWESQALVARIQRDEWKAKYIQQNKDLGCEMMDPNGTIWDYAQTLQRERDEARERLQPRLRVLLLRALRKVWKHG
jgi:hypothetical protein